MARVFSTSHIVCLPSSYGEGVPKALIEAAACGRPIVTTDIAGCSDTVRDGENGFLVPPRNSTALAAALDRLISQPGLRRAFGQRSRAIAKAYFSETSVVKPTIVISEELLGWPGADVQTRARTDFKKAH